MKKLVVAALLIVGMTTFAQEKEGQKRERLTSEEKVELQVKRMTKELNLNEKQSGEVKAIVSKQVQKREAKRSEMKEIKQKERAELKAAMEKEQIAVTAEMKKILTADQFTKWEKMREERKGKLKEKMEKKESRSARKGNGGQDKGLHR